MSANPMSLPRRDTDAELLIRMTDNSVWSVPVQWIAEDRAKHYASEFDGDLARSLAEDTLPLFADNPGEITDWSANNMNWSDVASHARKAESPPQLTDDDKQEAWCNGPKRVNHRTYQTGDGLPRLWGPRDR